LIEGLVTEDGTPIAVLTVGGTEWEAIVDTGFNGDLELPQSLAAYVNPRFAGRTWSELAAGQVVEEDAYAVDFPFDGQLVSALATFVPTRQILVGTRMMKRHELRINFVTQRVSVTRV
jgi:predicted aspartyl protease